MRWLLLLGGVASCLPLAAVRAEDSPAAASAAVEVEQVPDPNWGTLSLRLVYDGEPPKRQALAVPPPLAVNDETLVVNADDRGIANACVYLYTSPGQAPAKVHPGYERDAEATVTFTAAAGRFEPHVLLLRTTQTLRLSNTDVVGYNVKGDFFNNASFNLLLSNETTLNLTLPEATPAKVSCNIHPWMSAWILVRDNPYAAVSDKSGKVSIANLPVGKHTFVVWHETGYIREATVDGKKVAWPRGRMELEIQPGDNDLGDIKLSPEVFQRR